MTKHKEALDALDELELKFMNDDLGAGNFMQLARKIRRALQAASWQPIEEWDDDNTFGNYVLVAWENGLVEEMHWAAVRDYKKPKHHAGLSLKYFRRMPAAPVDGGG